MKSKFLFVFICFSFFISGQKISPETKISILTIGKGDELHSQFGHTALRVKDETLGIDIAYNFGYFDFNTPNFYLKFIKGDLLYHAEIEQYFQLIQYYNYLKREVKEQELNLSFEQKKELVNRLNGIILSDQRFYIYKFIDDNCTTRVQKIVSEITKTKLEKIKDTTLTYRQIINDNLGERYFEKIGINMIFGNRVDQEAKQLFLPEEFFDSLETSNLKQSTKSVLTVDTEHHAPWWNSVWLVVLFFVTIIVLNKKGLFQSILILFGLIGLFFTFIGLYSLHQEVLWNYNVLLINPILVFIILFERLNYQSFLKISTRFFYVCVIAYFVFLMNKAHFWLMIPYILFLIYLVWQTTKNKKVIVLS